MYPVRRNMTQGQFIDVPIEIIGEMEIVVMLLRGSRFMDYLDDIGGTMDDTEERESWDTDLNNLEQALDIVHNHFWGDDDRESNS